MKPRKYFPLGKAYGTAFCNRVKEVDWLTGNLLSVKHTLLVAPRRYGKSSLAEKAITNAKLPFVKINFHLCATEEEVAQIIVNKVIKLIGNAVGQVDKIITAIKKNVLNLSPKLSFGDDIATLELIPKQHINQAIVISEALLLLDKLLHEKDKKAVIFFDEFQEIAKISKQSNIEGAIRTAAQEMQNLSIIFSGSIRSLLLRMFEDESRPLYKLCRKLKLERIAANDYKKHLNKISLETWDKELAEQSFNEIMHYSSTHPYYVNYLCDILWQECDKLPTANDVKKAWAIVVEEEWSDASKEVSLLSLNQRKMLKYIATHAAVNLTSQETSRELMMATSTTTSALEALIEKDYIEIDGSGHYKIINPVIAAMLVME